jgi:hypothetical protein
MKIKILLLSTSCFFAQLSSAADWPGWRGESRNDLSTETGLMKSWPKGGPQKQWMSKEAGLGYSGFSISNGALYTMGAFGKEERLLAFNATSGKKVWELKVGELLTNGWGDGPRMTPTVSEGMIYTFGGKRKLGLCRCQKPVNSNGASIWLGTSGGKVLGWGIY